MYPLLPVSLDCPFIIVHSVCSNVYLSSLALDQNEDCRNIHFDRLHVPDLRGVTVNGHKQEL